MPYLFGSQDNHTRYFLNTNFSSNQDLETEIDMNADSWKLPVSIDDSQVTFDGKPLSLLYEENRRKAEDELQQRGRSREKSSRQRVKEEIHTTCPGTTQTIDAPGTFTVLASAKAAAHSAPATEGYIKDDFGVYAESDGIVE
ncbi:hypothetical protein BKA61DRAFT_734851 [Leptodontidium sp. MPI-SDFR-AT-0119]|nr:hypothetical protein BKA61DRAFT_734851 [Leptodontidium sp. MPI-SDFR-AT-0119]